MVDSLTPEDYAAYGSQRRNIDTQYGIGLANNQYSQDTLRNQYARQIAQVGAQYAQQRTQLPGSFAKRGMLNSGNYQRALTTFAQNRGQALGDVNANFYDQLGAYAQQKSALDTTRAGGISDIDAAQAARSATAAALRVALGQGYS